MCIRIRCNAGWSIPAITGWEEFSVFKVGSESGKRKCNQRDSNPDFKDRGCSTSALLVTTVPVAFLFRPVLHSLQWLQTVQNLSVFRAAWPQRTAACWRGRERFMRRGRRGPARTLRILNPEISYRPYINSRTDGTKRNGPWKIICGSATHDLWQIKKTFLRIRENLKFSYLRIRISTVPYLLKTWNPENQWPRWEEKSLLDGKNT